MSRFVITPPATAPLANLSGLDLAISPDGERIAYWRAESETTSIELYVRELNALEARALPGTDSADRPSPVNPFFSPDGKSIGSARRARGRERGDRRPADDQDRSIDAAPVFLGGSWNADNTLIFSSLQRLERVSTAGGGTPEPLMPRDYRVRSPVPCCCRADAPCCSMLTGMAREIAWPCSTWTRARKDR